VIATDTTTEPQQAPGPATPPPIPSGTRSGAVLAVASAISIVVNYVFLLAAGRLLGSDDYGSLAALLGFLAVVLIPAGALQMAMSRELSRLLAGGDVAAAEAFANAQVRRSLIATGPLLVVALALAVPLATLLDIHPVGLVVLADLTLATALVAPVAGGVLQGYQRFRALAAVTVVPVAVRLAFFAIAAAAGMRLGGALLATFLSAVVGVLFVLFLIRAPLRRGAAGPWPELRPFLRYLGPVVIGLVGIAVLTHVDILVVKSRFSAHDAGAYAAASAFARVGFFLPAIILAVIFPRTAARQARGQETEDILGRSLIATAVFCLGLAVFYSATGVGLVTMSFGRDFAEGGEILAAFAVASGLYSIANVLVGYHLSRGETRYAWIVAGGVLVQIFALAVIPSTLHQLVWTNAAVAAVLLVAHEVFVGSSVPALRAGLHHFTEGMRGKARRVTLETGAVLLGATALVCLLLFPVVEHIRSTVIGTLGSDSTGSVWWFWQLDHESGYHLLGVTHHTLTGAPLGWDQGNGLNIQWLLPYYPGYLATKVVGEVAAYNLVVLSGYILSGVAMYAVARYLGCGRAVSAWAGLVFIVFPWHLARAEHASLVHIEVLALLMLALVAAAKEPSWLRLGLFGCAVLACWLTSGYYGAEAVVTAVAFGVGAALTLPRRQGLRLLGGLAAPALAATALLAIGSFTSGVGRGVGLHRAPSDLTSLGLRPLDALMPADGNFVLGEPLRSFRLAHLHGTNVTEGSDYLGLLTIALAIAWLVVAWRGRRSLRPAVWAATAGLLAVVIAGILFAAPSPITIAGHDVWMPARLLWEVTPGFRVPSRWTPLIMAALVPLAALGLQWVCNRLAGRRRAALVTVAVVAVAAVFSFFELAISPVHHFRTTGMPAAYAAVERTPKGILADYPLASSDVFRFWQRNHGRPIVNVDSSAEPANDARLVLLDPAAAGTARALALLGVTSIVIHGHAITDAEVLPRTPAPGSGYALVGRYGGGDSVWRVTARPATALVTLPGGFGKPHATADGRVLFPLVSPGGVGEIEIRSKVPQSIRLVFDAEAPDGAQRELRFADADHEHPVTIAGRTPVSFNVVVPRGRSRLFVKTDPPATSEADAVTLTAPRAQEGNGDAVLQAILVSPDPGF